MTKRTSISAGDAVRAILQFVEEGNNDTDDDLDDLNGDDNDYEVYINVEVNTEDSDDGEEQESEEVEKPVQAEGPTRRKQRK